MRQRLSCIVQGAVLMLAASAPALGGEGMRGHIAAWHHRRAVATTIELPSFGPGRYFGDALVQIGPLPDNLFPDDERCFCYEVNDDRLAVVHTYYYAHSIIANYNALLRELHLPQLRDVSITLVKDQTAPTSASAWKKKKAHITLRYATPAIDPFTIAQAVGRLIYGTLMPRYRLRTLGPEPYLSPRQQAEEAGVEEGAANILAALELGTPGSLLNTSDTLDAPVADDVDTFVRFPDLLTTRRQVLAGMIEAPRFAARYSQYVAKLQKALEDPAQNEALNQPDENATAAVINQPLWQAAVRFGFKPAKILVLRTLAEWSSPDASYFSFGRELVNQAQTSGPKWALFLSEEYQRRGLPVPDARLEFRPN